MRYTESPRRCAICVALAAVRSVRKVHASLPNVSYSSVYSYNAKKSKWPKGYQILRLQKQNFNMSSPLCKIHTAVNQNFFLRVN